MRNKAINYLEVPSSDLPATKAFFTEVFDWQFTDYGDEYSAFDTPEMQGGFYHADTPSLTRTGGTLVVFYCEELALCQQQIEKAGGRIVKPIFAFPGGQRFHFCEPGGSEFAVWSE